MIHITNEGEIIQPGLNIGFGWRGKRWQNPWIRFIWCDVDFTDYTKSIYYFRLRTFMKPWFIYWGSKESIIENYCFERNLILKSKEEEINESNKED